MPVSSNSSVFIVVSGAPGAGKTTLATALAARLSLPLFSKDHIKESLAESLGGPTAELEYSRRLGGAAMELLWRLAADAPAAVLEANFRPQSDYERERLSQLRGRVIEVYCDCPAAEVARRFAVRAAEQAHPAHPLQALTPELLAEYDRPVGVGLLARVDTSVPVDIDALVVQLHRVFDANDLTHPA